MHFVWRWAAGLRGLVALVESQRKFRRWVGGRVAMVAWLVVVELAMPEACGTERETVQGVLIKKGEWAQK